MPAMCAGHGKMGRVGLGHDAGGRRAGSAFRASVKELNLSYHSGGNPIIYCIYPLW